MKKQLKKFLALVLAATVAAGTMFPGSAMAASVEEAAVETDVSYAEEEAEDLEADFGDEETVEADASEETDLTEYAADAVSGEGVSAEEAESSEGSLEEAGDAADSEAAEDFSEEAEAEDASTEEESATEEEASAEEASVETDASGVDDLDEVVSEDEETIVDEDADLLEGDAAADESEDSDSQGEKSGAASAVESLEEASNVEVIPVDEVEVEYYTETNSLYDGVIDPESVGAEVDNDTMDEIAAKLTEEAAETVSIRDEESIEVYSDEESDTAVMLYDDGTVYEVVSDTADTLDAPYEYKAVNYMDDIEEAAALLRDAMEERQAQVQVLYTTTGVETNDNMHKTIFDKAVVHTGVPTEGDYLLWHYAGFTASKAVTSLKTDTRRCYKITYSLTYYTTAAQEADVDAAVRSVISQLDLANETSEYAIIRKLYDYICENVTYDYANLYDDTYKLKHTLYAAIINKTAVCQGYALFFYRVALEMGIDSRLIAGYATSTGAHAWNIVQIGNVYYNLDATWDRGATTYSYFLQNETTFTQNGAQHKRWGTNGTKTYEYDTAAFAAAYPMSSTNYEVGGTTGKSKLSAATITLPENSYVYTGMKIKPTPTVVLNGRTLTQGTDFSVSYSKCVAAGTAEVTVSGKGSYYGKVSTTFTITPFALSSKTVKLTVPSGGFTYDGKEKVPTVKITGATLSQDKDYTVECTNNIEPGDKTARITVTGIGSCTGKVAGSFSISKLNLADSAYMTLSSKSFVYNGTQQVPTIIILAGDAELTEGTDYELSYEGDKKNVGTVTVKATGIAHYTGELSDTYTISQFSLADADISLSTTSFVYDGTAKKSGVVVKANGSPLTENTDYQLTYKNNIDAGTANVEIKGLGNCSGTIAKTYTIAPRSIASGTLSLSQSSYVYSGKENTPIVALSVAQTNLRQGTDYTFSFDGDTVNAGTVAVAAKGKGNYTGTLSTKYVISPFNLTNASISLSETSYVYDGTAKKPDVEIGANDTTLSENTDYNITYTNFTDAGTATIAIKGLKNYTGSVSKSYTIEPASIAEGVVNLSQSSFVYSGNTNDPTVSVSLGDINLKVDTDVEISYSGDKVNVGTVVVQATGKGNYTGTCSNQYEISPCDIAKCTMSVTTSSYVYDGEAKEPDVALFLDGSKLSEEFYDVSYEDNINAGSAKIVVSAIGPNYTGTQSKKFLIDAVDISDGSLEISEKEFDYDGTKKKPDTTVHSADGTKLEKGTDYKVSYENNIEPSTEEDPSVVKVTGIGNYSGTLSEKFIINEVEYPISETSVEIETKSFVYDGTAKKPQVEVTFGEETLVDGEDYTIKYENNTNAGTADIVLTGTGKTHFTGSRTEHFTIKKKPQSLSATLSALSIPVGSRAKVTVNTTQGTPVFESSNTSVATVGSDGTIVAKGVGTAKMTISTSGNANYGTAKTEVSLDVIPLNPTISDMEVVSTGMLVTWKKVATAGGYEVYRNGKKVKTITSGSTVSYKDTGAKTNGSKYSYVVYSYKKVGSKKYTSKPSGTKTSYFISKPTISSLKNSKSKQMTVSWKKNASATGYQIQYGLKSNFKDAKTITISKNSTVSKTITKLTKGKKYYVRMRTYKAKLYTDWSASKSLKIKK